MLLPNVIQPSSSLWSSPVLLLEKPNGEFRLCVDYRQLNAERKKRCLSLPRIEDNWNTNTTESPVQSPPTKDDVMVTIDYKTLQENDTYAGAMMQFLKHEKVPEDGKLALKLGRDKDLFFLGDNGCLHKRFKPKRGRTREQFVVPKSMVSKLLVSFHDIPISARPGFYRTYKKIQQSYFWPTMKTDVNRHVRHCEECDRSKASPKPAHTTPMKSIVTERPLQIVAMEFLGPLPMSEKSNMYALVMVDHFTWWPVVYAVQDTEAETVA